ncbi:MAG: 23S rRNA (adenine(1618)-N(6))-methyltransferase RlmF [Saprospiraceae bacterium]
MPSKELKDEKSNLHPRNRNRVQYDLETMAGTNSELKHFIVSNRLGLDSINYGNPLAVKTLNKSILSHYYGIKFWEFPDGNLCPPIPGRADYIHYMADLLGENNDGNIPLGKRVTCVDIGVGASCIYPIIGVTEYGWQFIGSDINADSIESSEKISRSNPTLISKIICKKQNQPNFIFKGIIGHQDKIDLTICNPPFHASNEEAAKGTSRKIKNLTGQKSNSPTLNFSGINNELIYAGGEIQFISNMISESKDFGRSCFWFSSLVSKESNLKRVFKLLNNLHPTEIKTINIKTGNKTTRIVAWTFLKPEEKKKWKEAKW